MPTKIKNSNYRIGQITDMSQPGYPQFKNKYLQTVLGSQIMNEFKVKTWEDFFTGNPLKLPSEYFHVYEILPDSNLKYIFEGTFTKAEPEQNLGDVYPEERNSSRTVRLNNRIAELEQDVVNLKDLNNAKDREIAALRAKNEKWFETDKIELERKIIELEHENSGLKNDHEKKIQALNDDYAARTRQDVEKSQIAQLSDQVQNLTKAQEERTSSLSGYGEAAAAIAVPILGKAVEVAMEALNRKYPNLIPSITKSFGGDATPAEAIQQGQQVQPQAVDASSTFIQR